jgi:hypothetical protein
MAFTRFHDDKYRIEKYLQQSTDVGRYHLNVPGNGKSPDYFENPYIRLTKWGGNYRTNHINLDSDLKGLTRQFTNDNIKKNDFKLNEVHSKQQTTNSNFMNTEQSRATHPTWETRDLEQNNFNYLYLDPQKHSCMPFYNNLNTRILDRDYFNNTKI